MDRLRSMQVFLEVARRGSFAGAARHLGMWAQTLPDWSARGRSVRGKPAPRRPAHP